MADPVNHIAAEFGEPDGVIPVPPVKPPQKNDEIDDAFKKEMEKQAVTVHEKEKQENRSSTQEEHEIAALKPLIKEAIDKEQTKAKEASDPSPAPSKQTTDTQKESAPPPQTTVTTPSSDASTDLSQEKDQFTQKLPTPPPSTGKGKKEVEYTPKQMPAPPLTTEGAKPAPPEEKKKVAPAQASFSAGQGDTSSKQRPPQVPLQGKVPGAPPPSKAAPSLSPPSQKPRIETHAPAPKIAAPKQELPSAAPSPKVAPIEATGPEKPSPLLEKSGEPLISPPQEVHEESLIDQAQKDTSATTSPFETPFAPQKKDEVIRTSKQELEQGEGLSPVQPPPKSDFSGDGKDQGSKQDQALASQSLLNSLYPSGVGETSFKEAVGFDRLPPHVLDLFDRIVGVITVIQMQGKTETVLHLSDQQTPLFKGAEVAITEVSTAPGSYNIELRGPPEAVAAFQQNVEQLKKAFQRREEEGRAGKKEFNFKVNDIRISLKEDKGK